MSFGENVSSPVPASSPPRPPPRAFPGLGRPLGESSLRYEWGSTLCERGLLRVGFLQVQRRDSPSSWHLWQVGLRNGTPGNSKRMMPISEGKEASQAGRADLEATNEQPGWGSAASEGAQRARQIPQPCPPTSVFWNAAEGVCWRSCVQERQQTPWRLWTSPSLPPWACSGTYPVC